MGQHRKIFIILENNHIFVMPSDRIKKILIFNKPYRVKREVKKEYMMRKEPFDIQMCPRQQKVQMRDVMQKENGIILL